MISDKTYDILKLIGQILPLVTTFIGTVGKALGWDCITNVVIILSAFTTLWNGVVIKLKADYTSAQNDDEHAA